MGRNGPTAGYSSNIWQLHLFVAQTQDLTLANNPVFKCSLSCMRSKRMKRNYLNKFLLMCQRENWKVKKMMTCTLRWHCQCYFHSH